MEKKNRWAKTSLSSVIAFDYERGWKKWEGREIGLWTLASLRQRRSCSSKATCVRVLLRERDVEFIVHGVSSSILLPRSIAFKVNNVIVLLNRIVEVAYADSSSKYNCYTFVSLWNFNPCARRFRINVMSKQLNTTKYSICIKTELNYGTYFKKKLGTIDTIY